MTDDTKAKKPKADRMHDHILQSCLAEGRPQGACDSMAWAVVNKWKQAHKQKHANMATAMNASKKEKD